MFLILSYLHRYTVGIIWGDSLLLNLGDKHNHHYNLEGHEGMHPGLFSFPVNKTLDLLVQFIYLLSHPVSLLLCTLVNLKEVEKGTEVKTEENITNKQTKNIPSTINGLRLWELGIGKKGFRTSKGKINGREKGILRLFLGTSFCFNNVNEHIIFWEFFFSGWIVLH